MEIRKSFLEMIRAFPGGWDSMSAALGMTATALENRIYERKGQGLLSHTCMQLQAFSGTTLYAEAVATASGGTFVKLPDVVGGGNEELMGKFHVLYSELGTFSQHLKDATADDNIDKSERKLLEADGARLHKVLAELQALTFRIYCTPSTAEDA